MTDKEKAHYFDEWHEYFEPLARIRREVVKSIPYAEKSHAEYDKGALTLTKEEYIIWWMQSCNRETSTEINNLIRTMLIEIEESDED